MTVSWYDMIEGPSGLALDDFTDEAHAPGAYGPFEVGLATDPLLGDFQQDFPKIAKGLDLTQRQAQSLLGYFLGQTEQANQADLRQQEAAQAAQLQAIKDDPEIASQGLEQTIKHAQKALKVFGSPALTQALDETALGLQPAFLKVAAAIGAAVHPYRSSFK